MTLPEIVQEMFAGKHSNVDNCLVIFFRSRYEKQVRRRHGGENKETDRVVFEGREEKGCKKSGDRAADEERKEEEIVLLRQFK